jgi:hypothetical protein
MEVAITWNVEIAKPTSVGNALNFLVHPKSVMTIWLSIVEVSSIPTIFIDLHSLILQQFVLMLLDFIC